MKHLSLAVLILCSVVYSGTAYSESALATQMTAHIVSIDKQGSESFKPAEVAEPGQIIEYRIEHNNQSDQPLKNIVTNGPVPSNTEYLPNSANTQVEHVLEVSIDGAASFQQEPVKRIIKDANGQDKEEVVPASEYTHVRWKGKSALAAGQSHTYTYRVIVQ